MFPWDSVVAAAAALLATGITLTFQRLGARADNQNAVARDNAQRVFEYKRVMLDANREACKHLLKSMAQFSEVTSGLEVGGQRASEARLKLEALRSSPNQDEMDVLITKTKLDTDNVVRLIALSDSLKDTILATCVALQLDAQEVDLVGLSIAFIRTSVSNPGSIQEREALNACRTVMQSFLSVKEQELFQLAPPETKVIPKL